MKMHLFNLSKPVCALVTVSFLTGCDTPVPSFQIQSVANNMLRPTTSTRISSMQQSSNLLDEKTKAATEPTGSDTYEVEMSVSEAHIRRLIQNYTRGLL